MASYNKSEKNHDHSITFEQSKIMSQQPVSPSNTLKKILHEKKQSKIHEKVQKFNKEMSLEKSDEQRKGQSSLGL